MEGTGLLRSATRMRYMADMAKSLTVSEFDQLLERFRATVEQAQKYSVLRKRIATVLSELDGGGTKAAKRSAQPVKQRARRVKRGTPKRSAQLRKRVLEALKGAKDGLSSTAVAAAVKARPEAVRYALARLRSEKLTRIIGERNQAKWHAAA